MGREKNLRLARQNARRLQGLAEAAAAVRAEQEHAGLLDALEGRGKTVGAELAADIESDLKRQAERWGKPLDMLAVDMNAILSEERRLQRALMEIPELDPEGPAWEGAAERFYGGIMRGLAVARREWLAASEERRLAEINRLVAESAKDGAPRKRSRKEELQISAVSA